MGCAGSSVSSVPTLALDFSDGARGGENDEYKEIRDSLKDGLEILNKLKSFKGCGDYIRDAITNPSPENEEAAWAAVVPSVDILKEFYEYSQAIEKSLTKVLEILTTEHQGDDSLSDEQVYTKQIAEVFDFVLRFDDLKMTNPAIQNDFYYYRRILNRIKLSNKRDAGITVNDELANSMSLFFAYPTPMMNTVIRATKNLITAKNNVEQVSKFLAQMAGSCFAYLTDKKFEGTENPHSMMAFRAMTGSIILYDHVNAKGAFHKKSPIQIRQVVQALKGHEGKEKTDTLINALRFNTVHLNDDDTPSQVKQILN